MRSTVSIERNELILYHKNTSMSSIVFRSIIENLNSGETRYLQYFDTLNVNEHLKKRSYVINKFKSVELKLSNTIQ